MNTYTKGATVRCSLNIQVASIDTDPTTLTFTYRVPGGAAVSYVYGTDAQLVRSNQGDYYVDLDANASGVWYGRWASTGTGKGAVEFTFEVLESHFA